MEIKREGELSIMWEMTPPLGLGSLPGGEVRLVKGEGQQLASSLGVQNFGH